MLYTEMMGTTPSLRWNQAVRFVLSDVDETIAEVYSPAEPEMIIELSSFLAGGGKLFLVTGGSLKRVMHDITDRIDTTLRHNILVSHCSGAEVWGFEQQGELRDKPFYSIYEETFTPDMKKRWRQAVDQLVVEFDLHPHPSQPKATFWEAFGKEDPRDIMLDDRGPQITLEVANGQDLSTEQLALFKQDIPETLGKRDLRVPLMRRAEDLFAEAKVPITPHLAGTFALDLAIEGLSKGTSVAYVLSNADVLATIGLTPADLTDPSHFEVWGDKYSTLHGGTDRFVSEALPPQVRSIDFRQEDPAELSKGYNIVFWDGEQHLHHGLLEYLQFRHAQ